ncbi:MAG: penicillin-binding protein 2 [Gammaproteobacteria bacterium]|nr:penicillin-binding protein 2 [Gammaproteobacteria bacterium]
MNDRRHKLATICFVAVAGVLVGQMSYIAFIERYFMQAFGQQQSERTQFIPVHRGMIYDRLGEPLAISTPVIAVTVNPSRIAWSDTAIENVAEILELDATSLRRKFTENSSRAFMYLARRQPARKALALQQLKLDGLDIQTEYRRYYPMGEVAAHLTGITDIDEQGLEGMEKTFDDHLKGEQGSRRVVRDRAGRLIRDLRYVNLPKFGEDLKTSIDSRLQFFAFKELENVVAEFQANAASMILLDVPTGGILALANVPSYNPNYTQQRDWDAMRNRAITDLVEPGSTFKPFVAMLALESGRYTPETEVDTNPGWIVVRWKTIEDPRNYGVLSLRDVLVKSSQVGATRIALDLDEAALLNVHERAGFSDFVYSGFPGETIGKLSGDDIADPITRATMSFGYGFSVTPMQLARAYLTIATGGVQRQISVLSYDERNEPDRRVFDERLTSQVMNMLAGVVGPTGTASKSAIPGFTMAGKTGTVRKSARGGYSEQDHVTLFVGMVPMRDPQFLGVVVVDGPKPKVPGGKVSGGSVSAPVFKRVATKALQLRGVDSRPPVAERVELDDAA